MDPHLYVFTTYGGAGLGVAYTGVVCYPSSWIYANNQPSKAFKLSMSDFKFDDDQYSGEVIAHEMGHTLGMRHDFSNVTKSELCIHR